MPNDIIQAQYEELANVASRFGGQAEASQQLITQVRQSMQPLQGGGWQGRGSAAFFAEMNGEVLPAMQRLAAALDQSRAVTLQMRDLVREAEEEASRPFRSDGAAGAALAGGATAAGGMAGGGPAGSGAVGGQGTPGVGGGAAGSGAAGGGPASGGTAAHQTPISPSRIFADQYMDDMVGMRFRGGDSRELNQAMETLAGNPTAEQREQALDQIAQARGLTREEVHAQYQRYQQLQAEAASKATAKGLDPSPPVNQFLHDRFMGSTTQLRYGKVVGDALGLDPVFGAMLNPSGGLVGPGNTAVDLGENPVGYHGVFHDAAGYLYNYHDTGPGYDYLGREGRDTSSPFTGQEAGIRYWNDKMGAGFVDSAVSNTAGTLIGTGQDIKEGVGAAIDWVSDTAGDVADWFGDLFD